MAKIIPVPEFDCVVFGATGDLTLRKLLPALYYRIRDGQMPHTSRVIAAARSDLTDESYRHRAMQAVERHVAAPDWDEEVAKRFCSRLFYARVDGAAEAGWDSLQRILAHYPDRVRVFYLATSPDLYGPVSKNLGAHGLVTEQSRVVLEKPIGHDLASARAINDEVGQVFSEAQIFRIDHYLGKETVQNLLALRFANSIFERLWNTDVIDHVQITVAETVGVEGRGGYYERAGALRDMVQNHMLQLLCLICMD
ncbi:MAG: glucose-6-phosphate dehydrogenase (NADP(+)), partial [Acetobacteraceae bacterium]|nr:glucose-6-phosphate dehydrogenase (NADP(+)) [Acetobacteraceae bacterium]